MPLTVPIKWKQRFATPLAPQLEGQELRTVVFVAISFHAVFTGYRSIQNLQSSLNEENGLGVISLGVLYGAWIFSGILTPTFIRFLTTKGSIILAWLAHVLYTTATFYPAWELLIPASLLLGAVSGPLWTSQSLYITACGYSHAKTAVSNPYHVFSRFNGIFFAIYETSQITGNLVASLVLQNGLGNRSEEMNFFQCGRGDCPASDNATDFEEPEDWVTDVLLAFYVTCNVIGIVVTYFFVMPLPKSDWSVVTSTKETMTSLFVTLRRTEIILLVPLFIFQGIQQAILYSEFTRSYISCPIGLHMVGFVMAAHGATTPVVTLLFSRVVRHTGRYPLFMLAGLFNLGLMVAMDMWTPDKEDVAFIFLAPICWGISEGIWMTQTNSLIAVQYPTQKEPAFALYHTSRSVGLTLTFALSSVLCASIKLVVGVIFVTFALILYTAAEVRIRWKEQRGRGAVPKAVKVSDGALAASIPALASIAANSGGIRLSELTISLSSRRQGRESLKTSTGGDLPATGKRLKKAASPSPRANFHPGSPSQLWSPGTGGWESRPGWEPPTGSSSAGSLPRTPTEVWYAGRPAPGMLARGSSSSSILSSLTLISGLNDDVSGRTSQRISVGNLSDLDESVF
ncbi:protein unc-93 homolog A-like [Littorina saxatilis]|uniref:Uncharacterized protein n=1 Tax=Littorina saxatilis TaxID=31220 RepID=A0AAN9FVV5_9CAEN